MLLSALQRADDVLAGNCSPRTVEPLDYAAITPLKMSFLLLQSRVW